MVGSHFIDEISTGKCVKFNHFIVDCIFSREIFTVISLIKDDKTNSHIHSNITE